MVLKLSSSLEGKETSLIAYNSFAYLLHNLYSKAKLEQAAKEMSLKTGGEVL